MTDDLRRHGFSPQALEATRQQAFGLYHSLQQLTDGLPNVQQRRILSDTLEEVVAYVDEMEATETYLSQATEELEKARKQAEQVRDLYVDLFETAPCGYIITDRSGMIRQANRAAGHLLNVRNDYLRNKPIILFIPDLERLQFQKILQSLEQSNEEPQKWVFPIQPRKKDAFDVQLSLNVVRGESGEIREVRWTLLDCGTGQEQGQIQCDRRSTQLEEENRILAERLTRNLKTTDSLVRHIHDLEQKLEAKTAEAKHLAQSQSIVTQYVNSACVEPVNRACHEVEQLAGEVKPAAADGAGERLSTVAHTLARMRRALEPLSVLAVLEETPLRREPVDTALLVAEVLDELQRDNTHRLDLRVKSLPVCLTDRELLRIVLRQLLTNALKFSRLSETSVIEVGCRPEKSKVAFYVRDNGIGFRKNQNHRLFLPFSTLHRSHGYEGHGIGLAVARQLVLRLGGQIWATGREGEGATFTFTLPHDESGNGRKGGDDGTSCDGRSAGGSNGDGSV